MRVIYIGPSVASLGLQRFCVYSERPVAAAGDKNLARLCVPVPTFRNARAALGVQGSPEWTAYQAALKAFHRPTKKRGDQ